MHARSLATCAPTVFLLALLTPLIQEGACAVEVKAEGNIGLTYLDRANPGRTDRGSDVVYSFSGEVQLGSRLADDVRTRLAAGAQTDFFSEYSDNNTHTYLLEARGRFGRTTLEVEYDFIPERLYFPSTKGNATYSRNGVEVKLSRRIQKSWDATLAYEARWADFVEAHDGRDNRTNIIQFELEYGKNRLLRPTVALEWSNRNSEDDNYDYRSREIQFSLESSPTHTMGLRLDYHVAERTYLTPRFPDSNYHRIDARSGLRAEARLPLRGPLGLILGYERGEKDSSREDEERSYRVNSYSCGLRLAP